MSEESVVKALVSVAAGSPCACGRTLLGVGLEIREGMFHARLICLQVVFTPAAPVAVQSSMRAA